MACACFTYRVTPFRRQGKEGALVKIIHRSDSARTQEGNNMQHRFVPCNQDKAMVVDDERGIVMVFIASLEHGMPDMHVDGAENGQVAVERFKKEHHAVLVMDLSMPIMDGQKAFRAIEGFCRDHNWEMPRVLFCTGYSPPGCLQSLLSDSPHGLLLKPVSGDDIVRAVASRLLR